MSYRILSILIISAALLGTGMMSGPARGDQITDQSQKLVSSNNTFEGLLAVKEADGVFVVRSEDGKKKRFTVDQKTVITQNGKPAAYSDLRSRDRVRVHYDSNFVVTEIQAGGS
jgi:hypothetical protein